MMAGEGGEGVSVVRRPAGVMAAGRGSGAGQRRGEAEDVDRLDALRTPKQRKHGGCRICGEPTAAIVRIELKRTHPEGKGYGPLIDAKQLSICEDCALDVWPRLREILP